MSFDSITLRSVTAQLNGTIIPGKIASIIQSSPLEFTLRIAAHGELHNLLFCIHPVHARMHLTKITPKREKRWHFADFLHKHIADGEINSIEQIDLDRIIKIRILPQGEIIDPAPKILIGEFMGKHSNVILMEEGTDRILESMKHIDETISRYREVLPGVKYVMPPAGQSLDLLSTDEQTFLSVLDSDKGPLWRKLLRNFQGLSPLLAKEAIALADDDSPIAVREVLVEMMKDIQAGRFHPTVITRDRDGHDVLAVSAIRIQQFQDGHAIEFPTISEALEYFYARVVERELLQSERAAILQAVKKKQEAGQKAYVQLKDAIRPPEGIEAFTLILDIVDDNPS